MFRVVSRLRRKALHGLSLLRDVLKHCLGRFAASSVWLDLDKVRLSQASLFTAANVGSDNLVTKLQPFYCVFVRRGHASLILC